MRHWFFYFWIIKLIVLAPLIYWIAYVWLTVDSFSSYFICSFKFFASNSSNRLFALNWILTLFIPLSITSQFYLKVSNRLRFLKISHVASTVHHLSCDSRLSRRSRGQDEIPRYRAAVMCVRERTIDAATLFVCWRETRAASRRTASIRAEREAVGEHYFVTTWNAMPVGRQIRVVRYRVDGLRNLTV